MSLKNDQTNFGKTSEHLKVLSMKRIIEIFFQDIQIHLIRFEVNFMKDLLSTIEESFNKLASKTDQIKIVIAMFTFYVNLRNFTQHEMEKIQFGIQDKMNGGSSQNLNTKKRE